MAITPNSRCPVSLGETLGRLTVTGFDRNKFGQTMALCQCSCGSNHSVSVSKLSSGYSKSCGCLRAEKGYGLNSNTDAVVAAVKTTYKSRAKKLGLVFNLTTENVKTLITSSCAYCGTLPYRTITIVHKTKVHSLTCNGIDRVENTEGYDLCNVVPCCQNCQYAKREMKLSDFREWALKLSNHLRKYYVSEASEGTASFNNKTQVDQRVLCCQPESTT